MQSFYTLWFYVVNITLGLVCRVLSRIIINYLNCSCNHIRFAFHPYIQKLLLQYSNVAKDNEIQFSPCLSLIFIYRSNEKMPLGLTTYTCLDNKMNIAVVKTFLRTYKQLFAIGYIWLSSQPVVKSEYDCQVSCFTKVLHDNLLYIIVIV